MCCTLAIALLFPLLHAYYYSCKNDDTITCANKRCAVPLGHWVSRYGTALGGTERRGKERKTPTDCLRATIEKHTPRTHARNVLFFRYLEGGAETDVDWNACPCACTREHAAFRKDGGVEHHKCKQGGALGRLCDPGAKIPREDAMFERSPLIHPVLKGTRFLRANANQTFSHPQDRHSPKMCKAR